MRRTLLLLAAVLLAGCLGPATSSQDEPVTIDGFTVERTDFTSIPYLQNVDGSLAYIGNNATGNYLVHGDTIVAHAHDIGSPAYNGTHWGYTTTRNGSDLSTVHIGGRTVGSYDFVFVETAGGEWAYGGERNGAPFLIVDGDPVDAVPGTNPGLVEGVNGSFLYVKQLDGELAVVHGDEVLARGDHVETMLGGVDGRPYYYIRTDRTVTPDYGNYTMNTTSIIYNGQEVGKGFYQVSELTVGSDGRLHYLGAHLGDDTKTLVSGGEAVLNASFFSDILPYQGSIAVGYANASGSAIYADGRTITDSDLRISHDSIDVVDGELVYLGINTSKPLEAPSVNLFYKGQRYGPFHSLSGMIGLDGRLVFTFQPDKQSNVYIARQR